MALLMVCAEGLVAATAKSEFSEATGNATETEQMKERQEAGGAEPEWAPGSRFRDCPDCPEMIVLPSGSFSMGSPRDEQGRSQSEGPVHQVSIAAPFAMGIYEVTFAEWNHCVDSGGCDGYRPKKRFFGRYWGSPRHPVMRVGWDDVQSYVAWLSQETGQRYRLPSEAEWEYAARGGTVTPYYTGQTVSQKEANYGRYFVGHPMPVGSFSPNPFGLYDMLGNVAEWCDDCWNGNYLHAPEDGDVWRTGNCTTRVLRGGHWASDAEGFRTGVRPRSLRAASRSPGPRLTWMRRALNSGSRDVTIGFRVVRDL